MRLMSQGLMQGVGASSTYGAFWGHSCRMREFIYIYILHTCVRACMVVYVHMYICICVYTYTHACMYACMYVCMPVYRYTHTYSYIYVYDMYICTNISIFIWMYAYRTYICIHMHISTFLSGCEFNSPDVEQLPYVQEAFCPGLW